MTEDKWMRLRKAKGEEDREDRIGREGEGREEGK
jgi:hypothetical protein